MANNIAPVPPDKIGETHAWREWFSRIPALLNGTVAGSIPITHNGLTGLQGGASNEDYHLSNAEHAGLVGLGDTTLHYHSTDRNLANAFGTLPVANGGTGVTASTGTGSVVLSASPTFTGSVTMSGATLNGGYTVATLPVGVVGARAYVTDATAPTFLGALTGAGTVKCPVFYNGTAWVSA